MTILGCEKKRYKKKLLCVQLCVASILIAVIALNILLGLFRTDAMHKIFLFVNIITDVIAIWCVYGIFVSKIFPEYKLLSFYERGEKNGIKNIGIVTDISKKTVCIQGLQCLSVFVNNDGTQKELYLISKGITLFPERRYAISTVDNVIFMAEEV